MDKIVLKDDLLLAKGGERFCFIHPEDKLKIIKTLNPELKIHNQQNELEYIYIMNICILIIKLKIY